ncbi:MAG: CRISPR-associated protein Csx3 [Oscillatoriales cyanobacterium RM2_1_1]|nr:CRISPR-associated protein Csx3 [Oscillatoriales cyanobacterium SM2_3_0]NJO47206.1 CRISPR-associated protein Csx3 [Oscillatoriales cyanobacterium RM2_1_1]
MLSADQLKGGKLLRIYGRSTVLASFAIASQVAHLYSAIAVFDPKLGDRGLDRYIVTISHSPQYQVGQTLELEYEPRSAVKVVLCGPANTGKTVLKEGLKLAILEHPDAPEDFYSISGCPDGDGSFYSETAQKYPELAKQLKQEYKAKFTPEFATSKARDIQRISNSLLLFDVGGKITTENQVIMSQATHAVILVKTEDEIHAWKHLCETELDKPLPIAAIVYSDYHGQVDVIESDSPVLQGKVHYLERGEDVSNRLMVKALADRLINLTREIPSQADGQIQSHKI